MEVFARDRLRLGFLKVSVDRGEKLTVRNSTSAFRHVSPLARIAATALALVVILASRRYFLLVGSYSIFIACPFRR